DVEVAGQTLYAFVNSMNRGQDKRLALLEKHGIQPDKNSWYNQQIWLNAFKDVAESIGDMNLFLIGVAVIDNAEFPPINNMEEGLRSIDIAYHLSHKLNGEVMFNPQTGVMMEGIGNYTLIEYNTATR